MVIRVWVERDAAAPLRARVTRTLDIDNREEIVSVASGVEEVCAIMRAWLDEFLRDGAVTGT
jgi:hypothetical protein